MSETRTGIADNGDAVTSPPADPDLAVPNSPATVVKPSVSTEAAPRRVTFLHRKVSALKRTVCTSVRRRRRRGDSSSAGLNASSHSDLRVGRSSSDKKRFFSRRCSHIDSASCCCGCWPFFNPSKMWSSRNRMLMDTDGDDVAFLSGSGNQMANPRQMLCNRRFFTDRMLWTN